MLVQLFLINLKMMKKTMDLLKQCLQKIMEKKFLFSNLGPDNDWRKILDKNQKLKFN